MRRFVIIAHIAAVTLLGVNVNVSAQSTNSDPGVQAQLDAMREEMQQLRQENKSMKSEIDELRAKTDENWLTEARAEEIRGYVEDVLADADMRASLLSDGLMAGWSDHFFLASMDGRFKLELEGQLQVRWIYNWHDQIDRHRQGFENTRTRLAFRGHVFSDDLQYMIRGDFARSVVPGTLGAGVLNLLDAWVRHVFNEEWSIRAGQFKLPFNREELVSSSQQLAVERSLINEAMNIGRSQGVELTYATGPDRFSVAVSDGASASGELTGSGFFGPVRKNTSALTEDVEYAVTMRLERLIAGSWDQFADFTSPPDEEFAVLIGVGGHVQKGESNDAFSASRNEVLSFSSTLDLSVELGGAHGFVSIIHHYFDTPFTDVDIINMIGVVAQIGVYIAPKWELFVRGEYGDFTFSGPSTVLFFSDLNVVTAGANYYAEGHDIKWTTDIGFGISDLTGTVPIWVSDLAGWRADSNDVRPQIVFRTQVQLLF